MAHPHDWDIMFSAMFIDHICTLNINCGLNGFVLEVMACSAEGLLVFLAQFGTVFAPSILLFSVYIR